MSCFFSSAVNPLGASGVESNLRLLLGAASSALCTIESAPCVASLPDWERMGPLAGEKVEACGVDEDCGTCGGRVCPKSFFFAGCESPDGVEERP